ncbi:MAG TPA: Dabb family protein [Acidimicrobiales bacterium]|nr:Dabb family protein [Acidimicrobiales bacterium]
MFRHVALFKWQPGVTADQIDEVRRALGGLPAVIAELRGYRVGADAGLTGGNWDFAVVADFDDEAGWRTYTDHPAHQKVGSEVVRPLLEARAAVQYEC